MLALDPLPVHRRGKLRDPLLAQCRAGVSANDVAQRFEFQHPHARVFYKFRLHKSLPQRGSSMLHRSLSSVFPRQVRSRPAFSPFVSGITASPSSSGTIIFLLWHSLLIALAASAPTKPCAPSFAKPS